MSDRLKRKQIRERKAYLGQIRLKQRMEWQPGDGKLMDRMHRDHLDVLQNIEFVLVTGYREDRAVDDRIVAEALKAAIHGEIPAEGPGQSLCEGLNAMRDFRADVSDATWRDALRTILQSVSRHSNARAGETGYLDFVKDFVF